MIWYVLFFLSLFCLAHSYAFYPLIVSFLSRKKSPNLNIFAKNADELPFVSVLLAAYNEEKVIREKITRTFNSEYPQEKIEMLIGSDASTDQTNEIIKELQQCFPNLKLVEFPGRTGKAGIINELQKIAQHPVLVLTDANVFFMPDTIYQMVKHFKNEEIVIVGGNIVNSRFQKDGISIQEETYISRENRIKYQEGVLWGAMAGAFGGCYAIRNSWYAPVPPLFFMDDFYITMNVIERKGKVINELEAVCHEDVSNLIREEFRRKIRISIGNFQNLSRYFRLVFPLTSGISFSFVSHKILRWFGPFFLIFFLVSNLFLVSKGLFFQITLGLQGLFIFGVISDLFFRKINIHINLLRFCTHFLFMNVALLAGFITFMKGVKTNIWQPTQRFQ